MEGFLCDSASSSTAAIQESHQRSTEAMKVEEGERCFNFMRRSKKSLEIYSNNNLKNQVLLQGYFDEDLPRTKSLTDEDLNELRGCFDLGFGFNYHQIPELCNTLPALELCYSMSQKFVDHSSDGEASPPSPDSLSSSVANWRISCPGDHPEDVKASCCVYGQTLQLRPFAEQTNVLFCQMGVPDCVRREAVIPLQTDSY